MPLASGKMSAVQHICMTSKNLTVFEDIYAILFDDPDHSEGEERFLIPGMSDRKGICIVSHCYRGVDNKIRMISARKATKVERNVYDEQFYGGE